MPGGVFFEVPENFSLHYQVLSVFNICFLTLLYLMSILNKDCHAVLDTLWVKNFTNVKIYTETEPIKVVKGPSKPLSKFSQYPLKPEAKEDLNPRVETLYPKAFPCPPLVPIALSYSRY